MPDYHYINVPLLGNDVVGLRVSIMNAKRSRLHGNEQIVEARVHSLAAQGVGAVEEIPVRRDCGVPLGWVWLGIVKSSGSGH